MSASLERPPGRDRRPTGQHEDGVGAGGERDEDLSESIAGQAEGERGGVVRGRDQSRNPGHRELHVTRVIDRLETRHPDISREAIEEVVRSAHSHFADRKVCGFVPLLVERAAREKIQELVTS